MGNAQSSWFGNGRMAVSENPDTTKIVLDGSGRPQYIGEAAPGSSTSASAWRIKKMTYDASSGQITDVKWAGGTNAYINVFDSGSQEYAGYSYS